MSDTREVNLIVKLGGTFSQTKKGGVRAWFGQCRVALGLTDKRTLIIEFPSYLGTSQYQLTIDRRRLKEAIEQLESFANNEENHDT